MTFGFRVGFSGSADLIVQLSNFKNLKWRLNAQQWQQLRDLRIDVMFGSRVWFLAQLI